MDYGDLFNDYFIDNIVDAFSAIMAQIAVYLAFVIIGVILVVVFFAIAKWKIFVKAGYEGWKSLIPFYDLYIMYEFSWEVKYFWIWLGVGIGGVLFFGLLNLIPLIGWIFAIPFSFAVCVYGVFPTLLKYRIVKSFGYDALFYCGLSIISIVFYPILAFGNAEYSGVWGEDTGSVYMRPANDGPDIFNESPQYGYPNNNQILVGQQEKKEPQKILVTQPDPSVNNNQFFGGQVSAQTPPSGIGQAVATPAVGVVQCIKGVAIGQGFQIPQDSKVVIGKNAQRANFVISDAKVSNVHCSIRYNSSNNTYTVIDHSSNGTYVNGVQLPKEVPTAYPAGTVISLADGKNEIKLG